MTHDLGFISSSQNSLRGNRLRYSEIYSGSENEDDSDTESVDDAQKKNILNENYEFLAIRGKRKIKVRKIKATIV